MKGVHSKGSHGVTMQNYPDFEVEAAKRNLKGAAKATAFRDACILAGVAFTERQRRKFAAGHGAAWRAFEENR